MTRLPLTPALVGVVAAGGAVGGTLRWPVSQGMPVGTGFPTSTFAINVVGSFLLAALPALAAVRRQRALAVALGPGVLGGFTTMSGYAEEGRALLHSGQPALAATYLLGTLGACLVAVHLAQRWSTPAARSEFQSADGDE